MHVSVLSPYSSASLQATTQTVGDDLGWRTDFEHCYVKGKVLGQGSFGVVHLGVNMRSGQEVAIKVLPKQRNKLTKERTLEKVVRETDILERLQSCRSVVQLEDCFEDESSVSLIMELCSGGDLQKHVENNGPLDERRLAMVASEVLKIISACHGLGILHGDVKPANFCLKHAKRNPFYSDDPAVAAVPWLKALDFGCSQHLVGSKRLSKRTGTPVYMAPEIFARDYGNLVDVWSTGVMLYWLFAQRFPFFPDADSVKASKLEEVAEAVTHATITYDYGPWLSMSSEGKDFVQGCLQRDPCSRMTVAQALSHPWLASVQAAEAAAKHQPVTQGASHAA